MTALFGLAGSEFELDDFRHPDQAIDRLAVSSRVKAVLKRATDWKPDRRFATIREFCEQLQEAVGAGEPVRESESLPPVDQVENEKAPGIVRPEPARSSVLPTEVVNSIGMKLKLIPAGEFLMGSPESDRDAYENEKPQHRVWITQPFYLGIHPVTRGQFQRFVEATRYQTDAEKDGQGKWGQDPKFTWRSPGFDQTDDHPVVNVSWNDATAFSAWLSRQEGQEYRLPTEAEWEYACRAGTTTRLSFGDDEDALGQYAWYAANSKDQTHPVGEKKPNAFGLYDMHGNVWEWCWDGYDAAYYQKSPAVDPRGPDPASDRVFRGGSQNNEPRYARSAYRYGFEPDTRHDYLGFRLALVQSGR
jgi:formylglycine-generating enzyme required for sulfatase activity